MQSEAEYQEEELAEGTLLLRGQYDIQRPLAKGGFGITYLARDSLNRKVVVKECYPHAFSTRVGSKVMPATSDCVAQFDRILAQFKSEALRLAALSHPRIVAVHQVFEENGTAYLAMEHIAGDDLFTVADEQDGRLDVPAIRDLMIEALKAVQYIHDQGMLHRDLAPDNMILDADNHLTIIDFGAACEMAAHEIDKSAELLVVKDGYSAHEFYCNGPQDASSDLYSLAATFHYLITGYSPPDSNVRLAAVEAHDRDPFVALSADAWGIDQQLLDTINAALCLHHCDRPRSASDWLRKLETTPTEASVPTQRAPMVLQEPIIADEIAKLVNATNSALERRLSQKQIADDAAKGANPSQEDAAPEPKQLVDIFGNPVHDVDAYLKAQEKALKKNKKQGNKSVPDTDQSASDPAQHDHNEHNPSIVGRMLKKMRPRKRNLASAVPQN